MGIRDSVKYDQNPFVKDMKVPLRNKQVRVSRMGDDVLVNQATGEVKGTHVISYKKVDSQQFVKMFTQNIALTFNLTSAGIKAFNVLMFSAQSQRNVDTVSMDLLTLDDFLHANSENGLKLTRSTFYRGIDDLIECNIIASTRRTGQYFINPNFIFNGDRVAFTQVIERI